MSKKESSEKPERPDAGEFPEAPAQAPEEPTDGDILEAHREAFESAADESDAVETPLEDLPLEEQVERLRAQFEESKDQALRHQAELDNYRKRAARQIDQERRYAAMPIVRDLLPVWDNIGRAIEAAAQSHDTSSLLEGFKMTAEQLESALARHHCSRIEALHQPFDPNLHEAISQLPDQEHPAGTVTHVAQTGYLLHDRVVRPSQVVVSSGNPDEDQSPKAPEQAQETSEESDEQPA